MFKCYVEERPSDWQPGEAPYVYHFPVQPQRGDYVRCGGTRDRPKVVSGTVIGFGYAGTSKDEALYTPTMYLSKQVPPDHLDPDRLKPDITW